MTDGTAGPPWVLRSPGGLTALLVDGAGVASLGVPGLELVQHAASAFEPGLLQLWLRAGGRVWPLLGARSGGSTEAAGERLTVRGGATADDGTDLRWRVVLTLDPGTTAWAWHVEVVNQGTSARRVDLVHSHDVALAAPAALRTNELYVSQYLEVRPLPGPLGPALAVRQNLAQGGRVPWCVLTATAPVQAWATDALDVHGWSARAGAPSGPTGDLTSVRTQHEHTLATLQTRAVDLAAGEAHRVSFAGLLVADHPGATGDADLDAVAEAVRLARASAPWDEPDAPAADPRPAPRSVYDPSRTLTTRALAEDALRERWPGSWRVVERDDEGAVLSFFTEEDEHVVTRGKELTTLRPHGTILRTGSTAAPDPAALTVTAWMTGSPLSYLTRGHASTGSVLTTVRGYLGHHRAYGLRVLTEVAGRWRLLDLPSAFAMALDRARWVHVLAPEQDDPGGTVEVTTSASAEQHHVDLTVEVTDGPPRPFLVALHLATPDDPLPPGTTRPVPPLDVTRTEDGLGVPAARPGGPRLHVGTTGTLGTVEVSDDSPLFDDGTHRVDGVVTLRADGPVRLRLRALPPEGADDEAPPARGEAGWWAALTRLDLHAPGHAPGKTQDAAGTHGTHGTAGDAAGGEALDVTLPWLIRDALVHYLSPRGLEQYTGGAWGTRDVSQGPLELLLALDRLDDARALVLRVFAAQNADGTWPQAFGFLPGDEHVRSEPPHGDVIHWPVLALGRYLLASGDAAVLDVPVPWYAPPGAAPASSPLRDHVLRAVDHAARDVLPGTHLVAYGHGDWNDSLQPADPAMAQTMVSAWTVTLHHQSLTTLADGLETGGADPGLVDALRTEAAAVAADLQQHLVVDGELAGYAQLGTPDGQGALGRRLLVHPRDTETGLRHGALQMIHALGAGLLDPAQAAAHVALVREHLMGVDGVRLFDRPPAYHGGLMRHFQRAETATFVGREIGLMYVHAHLRWCEAMATWGDADALWLGIQQVIPAAATRSVPGARRRQANTYPSSSDAACRDREDFAARYPDVLTGSTGLEGGWRIYSSGPGVLLRIVVQSLLGVRRRGDRVEIDPVLPERLDGLTATVPLGGGLLHLRYEVGPHGCGPTGLRLDGQVLEAARADNPYRTGPLTVEAALLEEALRPGGPVLEVTLP